MFIPTFPVRGKNPSVKGWDRGARKALLSRSAAWANRKSFADVDAFGILCGKLNGITVLDIDTTDEKVWVKALDACGPSPFLVRTQGGKLHAYYRHSGEGRKILLKAPDKSDWFGGPVDVLGGGYVVGPRSIGERGKYEIIQGNLGDLAGLPRMDWAKLPADFNGNEILSGKGLLGLSAPLPDVGNRNEGLFRLCLAHAQVCADFEALLGHARATNLQLDQPLAESEVLQIASSAWGIQSRGSNRLGIGRYMVVTHDMIDAFEEGGAIGQDANWLLHVVRRECGSRPCFYVANGMHERLGWSRPRLKNARDFLEQLGEVVLIRKYSIKNGPAIYRLRGTPETVARDAIPLLDAERARHRV